MVPVTGASATSIRRSPGFTLVEIAVVLLIIGMVTVFGARMVASVAEGTRSRATKQNMESIKLALQAFIAQRGRLPCPAVETLASSNAAFGIEAPNPGTCTASQELESPAVAFRGTVPWKTLGLTTDVAYDGWSNQITYVVSKGATSLTPSTVSGMRGTIYVHSGTPPVAGLPATGNQVNACSTTANDNGCNAAAVVLLLSHGKNGAGGYTSIGAQAPPPTAAAELENTDNDRNFVMAEPSDTFDDILTPFTPDGMLGALFVQGVVRPPQSLVLEGARQVVGLIAANQVSLRTGGPGTWSYPMPAQGASVAYTFVAANFVDCDVIPPISVSIAPGDGALVRDPWGNQYRYARASATVAAAESCVTPAPIVSFGPDGVAGGGDDFVYYAPLAEWKDIFGRSGW